MSSIFGNSIVQLSKVIRFFRQKYTLICKIMGTLQCTYFIHVNLNLMQNLRTFFLSWCETLIHFYGLHLKKKIKPKKSDFVGIFLKAIFEKFTRKKATLFKLSKTLAIFHWTTILCDEENFCMCVCMYIPNSNH